MEEEEFYRVIREVSVFSRITPDTKLRIAQRLQDQGELICMTGDGVEKARTGAFLVIAMTQVFNVFNMRDMKKSVFSIGLFSNKWINMALAASFLLQYAVVQVPFLRSAFGISGMHIIDFFLITAMSTTVLWAGEAYKYLRYGSSR